MATDAPDGILRGGDFSSSKCVDFRSRHFSLARHCCYHSVSFAELAAPDPSPSFTCGGKKRTCFSTEANAGAEFGGDLCRVPNTRPPAQFHSPRRDRMELHGTSVQLANDAAPAHHHNLLVCDRPEYWTGCSDGTGDVSESQTNLPHGLATRYGSTICPLPGSTFTTIQLPAPPGRSPHVCFHQWPQARTKFSIPMSILPPSHEL